MTNPEPPGTFGWTQAPSAKARNAVQRAVTALLDELAPERVLGRSELPPDGVEQFRTPTGCVLQAPGAALSVSWFAEASDKTSFGELHVVVWRGTVTRRGGGRGKPKAATEVASLAVRPIEPPDGDHTWVGPDGTRYNAVTLAGECLRLLQQEMGLSGGASET